MKFLNIFSLKVLKLFGCLSFVVTVLAFDVLGRTSASIVYVREKSVIKGNNIPLPEKVNLGLYFHFETN